MRAECKISNRAKTCRKSENRAWESIIWELIHFKIQKYNGNLKVISSRQMQLQLRYNLIAKFNRIFSISFEIYIFIAFPLSGKRKNKKKLFGNIVYRNRATSAGIFCCYEYACDMSMRDTRWLGHERRNFSAFRESSCNTNAQLAVSCFWLLVLPIRTGHCVSGGSRVKQFVRTSSVGILESAWTHFQICAELCVIGHKHLLWQIVLVLATVLVSCEAAAVTSVLWIAVFGTNLKTVWHQYGKLLSRVTTNLLLKL